ncbi:hypothetical protein AtDm6_2697 [Acetobacter tropicalis]|uniref:Uncharacterized protein n=1 Tax=Acetobacter tropicalis TaxID=104102 RepID=A0A094ZHA5_9PROT|nr:hypothetical protein AtDm6_2697 [Acetobacter tropicalis]
MRAKQNCLNGPFPKLDIGLNTIHLTGFRPCGMTGFVATAHSETPETDGVL